jgi:hypothetical protein
MLIYELYLDFHRVNPIDHVTGQAEGGVRAA